MAHEIDAVKLVTEALAGGERGLEIGLAEHISVDRVSGDDGGVARVAADQRYLAEEPVERVLDDRVLEQRVAPPGQRVKIDLAKQAAMSQLQYFKLAVLGGRRKKD